MSLAFASLDKKVLLVGCDLRNPQIHSLVNEDKNQPGLVNFLMDQRTNWKQNILKKFDKFQTHSILLCGSIPPNPHNLINSANIDVFFEQAKKEYDYIIVDTAPTLLVADTLSIIKKADAIAYICRCNVTDQSLLNHVQKLSEEYNKKFGLVINAVGVKNNYGYSYKYNYGYNYGYQKDEQ